MMVLWILFAFLLIVSLAWRLICMRKSVPWPSFLAFMLENPYMLLVHPASRFVSRIPIKDGDNILDVGCGAGRICIPAVLKGGSKCIGYAVDGQSKMLLKTIRRAKKHHISKQVKTYNSWFPKIPAHICNIDHAFLVTVLGELPQQRELIQAIYNALKPGGTLTISEVIPDPCYIPKKDISNLCKSSGFQETYYWDDILSYTIQFKKPQPLDKESS